VTGLALRITRAPSAISVPPAGAEAWEIAAGGGRGRIRFRFVSFDGGGHAVERNETKRKNETERNETARLPDGSPLGEFMPGLNAGLGGVRYRLARLSQTRRAGSVGRRVLSQAATARRGAERLWRGTEPVCPEVDPKLCDF
jgi:hypothetical protein